MISASLTLLGSMGSFDRFQFAFTIASHITLVLMSIALIVVIVLAEFLSIYRKDDDYAILAKRLTKVFTISFGAGTASGIVMAVELVTLFPSFMTVVGETGVITLFYFEVFAFFLETLFLVLYVYYANALGKRAHLLVGALVAAGALISAWLIVSVNAWMNTPNGLDAPAFLQGIQSGNLVVTGVLPWAPFAAPSTFGEVAHVLVTTLFAGTMILGGYFAYRMIRYRDLAERPMLMKGLRLTWGIGIVTLVLAGLTGTNEMATLLVNQPLKYSALDHNLNPGVNLPESFLGITIPSLQGALASFETGVARLPGLSEFPKSTWPPLYVNTTFDLMVLGAFMAGGYFLLYLIGWALKKKPFEAKALLYLQIPAAIGSYLVYQFGWVTDEVGRQPWIIYGLLTVEQAANQTSSVVIPGLLIMAFYIIVIPATFYFFVRVFNSPVAEGTGAPEGGRGAAADEVNY